MLINISPDNPGSTLSVVSGIPAGFTAQTKMENKFQKLSRAIEQSPTVVIITDTEGTIEYVNSRFTQLTGYTMNDVIGKNPRLLKSGKTPPEMYKQLWSTVTSGKEWHGEFCNKKKKGELYWESVSISPVKDMQGNITHFVAAKEDITSRKRMEQRVSVEHTVTGILSESTTQEDAFPKILQAISGTMDYDSGEFWIIDRYANVLRNRATWYSPTLPVPDSREITRQTTLSPGAGLPGRVWQNKEPAWINNVTEDMDVRSRVIQVKGEAYGALAFPMMSLEECLGVMCFYGREIQQPDDEFLSMMRAVGDQIVQFIMRKRAEKQLNKLSHVVEQNPATIVITDTNGYIQYVNPKFTQVTGYTLEDSIGKNACFLESGMTAPEEYKRLWGTITSGEERCGETINRKKNGELYWARVLISSIKNGKGDIVNFVISGEDITDVKQTRDEQDKLRTQLYHAQKLESIGRLASGVAHDFNNILMVIVGCSNLIQMGLKEDDPLIRSVHMILESAERGNALISGLLAFGRKQAINIQCVNINKIIIGMKGLLEMFICKNIGLHMVLTEKACVTMADRNQIEQVFTNLATNARDAMPDGGALTIRTDVIELGDEFIKANGYGERGNYIFISFSDTGTGIDESCRDKIFEPFFTTKDSGKGTGLGLSIIYGIVKQHKGYINFDSKRGKGTTFNIYLPFLEDDAKEV